jgi:hypothetical protein
MTCSKQDWFKNWKKEKFCPVKLCIAVSEKWEKREKEVLRDIQIKKKEIQTSLFVYKKEGGTEGRKGEIYREIKKYIFLKKEKKNEER